MGCCVAGFAARRASLHCFNMRLHPMLRQIVGE
jgi:hypothetical protein